MKSKSLMTILALAVLGMACLGQAQTEKKPLTNADVVQMVKAGLAENVIIGAIGGHPANYDTSPIALIELNQQGISPKVQEAMLAAAKSATPSSPPDGAAAPANPAPGKERLLNRVFVFDHGERREMQQNKGEIRTFAAPFFVKIFTRFDGRRAEFRIADPSPAFEVALLGNWVPAEHVKLVKPDVTKDSREVTMQGMAGPGVPIKMDKKAYVGLQFEELRKDDTSGLQVTVHKVKTTSPLARGEYVLAVDGAFYCFGVD